MYIVHLVTPVLLSTLLSIAALPQAKAFCRLRVGGGNSQECQTEGTPLKWEQRCIRYAIYEGGSKFLSATQVQRIVAASFETWNTVRCNAGELVGLQARLETQPSSCDIPQYNQTEGNANTVIFVQRGWDEESGRGYSAKALAVTKVWHGRNSGEIFDVDIEINEDTAGPLGACDDPDKVNCDFIDLQNTLTHEIGHLYGLGHPPLSQPGAEATTMFPGSKSDESETSKRTLAQDDINGLCAVYPENTLDAMCTDNPKGGLLLECGTDTGGCGCAVPGLDNHRQRSPLFWLMPLAFIVVFAIRSAKRLRQSLR